MLSPHRPALLAAAAAATALLLAGCATPTAHGGDGGSRAPTTTPSPTPSQSAIPQSGLPLGCADLESAAFVSSHYQGDTIAKAVDENSTARGWYYRAFQQGGGLRCVWGGSGRTDGGYDLGMELMVLTDAATNYATFTTNASARPAWVLDRMGDHSKSFCSADPVGFLQCYGDVLLGTTWLDFRLTDDNHVRTLDQAYAWADEQLAPAIAAISKAGPARPLWKPPASAFDTSTLCDAATATAIAGGPVTVTTPQPDATGYPVTVGLARAAQTGCTWASGVANANVDISGLTGGAWALPVMMADLAEAPGILGGSAQPVTIAGADGAFVSDGEAAWGAVITGGSLVEMTMPSSYTGADDIPLLTKIAAYIGAHR